LVVLGGASPTHPVPGGEERKGRGRGDSREQNIGSEEKRMRGKSAVIDRGQQKEVAEGENGTGSGERETSELY
jgi:hypothetical protein